MRMPLLQLSGGATEKLRSVMKDLRLI
jgi:hypothetical protein